MRAGQHNAPIRCDDSIERQLRARGFLAIAGIDEAGRGSLFGPVFAAVVVLSPDRPIRGLNDSKLLLPEEREALAPLIRERAAGWAVAAVDAAAIDRINIYQASRLAMKLAVEQLSPPPGFLLIDAMQIDLPIPQHALIKGDARCRGIAAASILAKVHRDDCMNEWDQVFPQYNLAHNKGYATPGHYAALEAFGPSPLHRFSFEPVRQASRFPCIAPDRQLDLFAGMEAGG